MAGKIAGNRNGANLTGGSSTWAHVELLDKFRCGL
jgi:hypothetical protein